MIDGLARNSGLPPVLIRRMIAARVTAKVAERPDLTEDMIAAIIETGDHRFLHTLALNANVPQSVVVRLSTSSDESVRGALAARAGRPREVYAALVEDPFRYVREWLAQNDDVPDDLRARLADDPDTEVRALLGRWWVGAPDEVRRKLLTDPVDHVRGYACSTYYARLPHPVPPADLVPALVADPVTRAGVIRHLPGVTAALASDVDDDVRREVAAHPGLAPELRDRLGDDPAKRVRVAVFARPDTPPPLRQRIYDAVAWAAPLSLSADADDEALVREVEDMMAATELRHLDLPWVTADPLPHVGSPYPCFRASAARSTSLPPDVQRRLLDDERNVVRTAMFRTMGERVDPATAERIERAFGPNRKIRWRPADDYTFPVEFLRRFATDDDPRMRCLAPRDPDLPPEACARLAADDDAAVRGAVASHPNLPPASRLTLLTDGSVFVSDEAAASPHLPVAEMERLVSELT